VTRLLEGQVAVVTGAASGIGRGIASAFVTEGARIALLDLPAGPGSSIADDLRSAGADATFVPCDVRSSKGVTQSFTELAGELGRIDALVCSAGVRAISDTLDVTLDEWEETIAVNLSGTFFCCQAAARIMRKQSSGAIVNIASISGLIGESERAAYVAAKHGVVGLTKAFAADMGKHGVRVNAICPGLLRTPMTELYFSDPSFEGAFRSSVPLGLYGQPRHIADAAVFLASSKAEYITGAVLAVDGGFTAEKSFAPRANSGPSDEWRSSGRS